MILTAAIALAVGLGGVALFVQLGPAESVPLRVALAVLLYLLGGAAVGALHSSGRGWALAALNAWSGVLLGSVGLGVTLTDPRPGDLWLSLAFLSGPLALSLAGGWIGSRARRLSP